MVVKDRFAVAAACLWNIANCFSGMKACLDVIAGAGGGRKTRQAWWTRLAKNRFSRDIKFLYQTRVLLYLTVGCTFFF